MSRLIAVVCAMLVAGSALAGCGGGSTARVTPRGGLAATPSPTPTPAVGGTVTAAQVNSAFAGVATTYGALPHTDPVSDISALAKSMVTSGAFSAATVTPGGITATLPDGSLALVFADVPEEVGVKGTAAHSRRAASASSAITRAPLTLSQPSNHEYAFLFNDTDPNFNESFDQLWAAAFTNFAFKNAQTGNANTQYGVTTGGVSLANVITLGGGGHPIDFLNITTHGMIGTTPTIPNTYFLLSTTNVDAGSQVTYKADLVAQRVVYAMFVTSAGGTLQAQPTFAFSPAFLTAHLQFNPGAIVNFAACFGANPLIKPGVSATLQAAGVGRYYGWTKAVGINDDYESLSFLFDRLLGEQSPSATGLDGVATQRVPAQRPFPLDKIYPAMNNESRNSPKFGSRTEVFGTSDVGFAPNNAVPPTADGTAARFDFADFGAEGVAGAPIAYALPSIGNVAIEDLPASATLTISGSFPPAQGTVQMVDSAGAHALTVTAWQPTQITATLASNGPAFGQVQVLSDTGVASNSVPITQWTGTLAGTQDATFTTLGGQGGDGGGQILTSFAINFRADVHPTVQVIDTEPIAQNFVFNGLESGSSGQVTSITGSFTTSDGKHTATFGLSPTAGTMPAAPPPFSNTFDVGPVTGQPNTCNSGLQGPTQSGAADFYCPGIAYDAASAGTCLDDGSGLCLAAFWDATGGFGSSSTPGDGLLIFQMDPTSYAVTVSSVAASSPGHIFESNDENVTGNVTGTINAPVNAPTSTTTSAHSRRTR
jgi:hypothetical protein